MSENNLPVCLTLLRVSRGWNQEELAHATGIRPASISSYERGKLIPSIKMLHRLTAAMGYTLGALEVAQEFLVALETQASTRKGLERTLEAMAQLGPPKEDAARSGNEPSPDSLLLARHREIDQVSTEVGRVASRMASLFFTLIEPHVSAGRTEGNGEEAP